MEIIIYDGTFAGFLTAVFEVYEYKVNGPAIRKQECIGGSLFGGVRLVETAPEKVKRVWLKLQSLIPSSALLKLRHAFLSEEQGIEDHLFEYIRHTIKKKTNVEKDYSNKHILAVERAAIKTGREAHRMTGFIRFQRTADDLYFATIEPDHDVLPLIIKHFKDRFSAQKWLIYDLKRKYGIYYDLDKVSEVSIGARENLSNESVGMALHEEEKDYQTLWKEYFKNTNIAARKNMKLHIQHLPKRYWKHLTEKIL